MDKKQLLGKRIKEIIRKKGLSQEKLAELVGIEPTALSNIVTGRNYPLLNTLERLIEVLGISFTDVFSFEHQETDENLRKGIIKILDENPERVKDFYKIAVALTKL